MLTEMSMVGLPEVPFLTDRPLFFIPLSRDKIIGMQNVPFSQEALNFLPYFLKFVQN